MFLLSTLLSVLTPLVPPSAWAVGAAGAVVGLMAETMKKYEVVVRNHSHCDRESHWLQKAEQRLVT